MYYLTQLFADAPHVVQVLALLQLAFSVWMMVDAYHRAVESFWYWIILFFQPVGAWVYFFAVKVRTFRLYRLRHTVSWESKVSLDELRYCVDRAPTVANRFALAERLMEKGTHGEAIPLLEAVLAVDPDYCPVLHALAVCRLALNDAELALVPIEKLMVRDPRWSNYLGWRTLIEVHVKRGQPAEALAACREYAKRQPSLENRCMLAEQLLDNDRPSEAVHLLDEVLEEHQFAPWSARWRNASWARRARKLLAEAEKSEKTKQDGGEPGVTADRPHVNSFGEQGRLPQSKANDN